MSNAEILQYLKSISARLERLEKSVTILTNSASHSASAKRRKTSAHSPVKAGSITINRHRDVCLVTGDTYEKKHIMNKYNGKWEKSEGGWLIQSLHYDRLFEELKGVCLKVQTFDYASALSKAKPNETSSSARKASSPVVKTELAFHPDSDDDF